MAKNIRKKDHPIQYEIARLRRKFAENADNIRFVGKLLALMSIPILLNYTLKKLPALIENIKDQQALNRANAIWRFENMPVEERNRIWTKKQQEAIFEHIDNLRAKERY